MLIHLLSLLSFNKNESCALIHSIIMSKTESFVLLTKLQYAGVDTVHLGIISQEGSEGSL